VLTKIKEWLGVVAAVVIGALMFMLRNQKKATEQAHADLGKALFKNETQENDHAYEDAKANADRLVTDYQSARRSDTTE
jgi:uncharacterized membrane-anchored protein YhcB (DUF1043 family)